MTDSDRQAHRRALLPAYVLAGVALLLVGCIMPGAAQESRSIPPILCEKGFANFATVGTVAYSGISSEGQVLAFDSRAAGLGGFTLLDLALPERPRAADLLHRYVVSTATGTVVPAETLARIATLTAAIRNGAVSREPGGADIGQATFECYVAMPEGIRFQRVTVAGEGDWQLRNTHPDAAELAALLSEILGPLAPAP